MSDNNRWPRAPRIFEAFSFTLPRFEDFQTDFSEVERGQKPLALNNLSNQEKINEVASTVVNGGWRHMWVRHSMQLLSNLSSESNAKELLRGWDAKTLERWSDQLVDF